jgi:hypothetical protein
MWEFETEILDHQNTNLWGGHIIVSDLVANEIKEQRFKRFICSLNDEVSFHCALLSMGNGLYFINVNKEIQKKLKVGFGAGVKVNLREDKSKYGIPLPEEMKELINQDDQVNQVFHSLSEGKQRSLLYVIGKPKTSKTRLKKAVLIARYLVSMNGNLDFRELNNYIKEHNHTL